VGIFLAFLAKLQISPAFQQNSNLVLHSRQNGILALYCMSGLQWQFNLAFCNTTVSNVFCLLTANSHRLILQNFPRPSSGLFKGVLMALATAILGSLANVIISKCDEVCSSVMVFYSGLGTVILSAFSVESW
jgi:hypothetical protein